MFLSCAQAYEPRAGVAARVTTLGIRTSATVLDNIVLQFEMCRNPNPLTILCPTSIEAPQRNEAGKVL